MCRQIDSLPMNRSTAKVRLINIGLDALNGLEERGGALLIGVGTFQGRVSRSSGKVRLQELLGSSSHLSLVVVEDAPEWGCEGIGLEGVVGDLINYFQMECGK
ncbi:hypothetical protein CDAR_480821 [Caerostris darwini]|uniref:Uncharacterized protein n=1 Tax=Caerostris darwini TaxID=1538125 RepID=A0AAV4RZR2_9ARAC|nr:hypothetical protein CDAR_480821 [Caerostris darwini]